MVLSEVNFTHRMMDKGLQELRVDKSDESPTFLTRKKRILVVDDEQAIRALFQEVLESNGYQVQVLDDGDKVLLPSTRAIHLISL